MKNAKVYEQTVVFPTYRVGDMEKNPLFIEKRAYQGSTGKVYPVPICEKISEEKENVEYKAVILENDYLYVISCRSWADASSGRWTKPTTMISCITTV